MNFSFFFQALSSDFSAQIQDLKVGARDMKIRNQFKINSVTLRLFRVIFETLEQILHGFIRVSSSFIDSDAYFKALIHFLKLHLDKNC